MWGGSVLTAAFFGCGGFVLFGPFFFSLLGGRVDREDISFFLSVYTSVLEISKKITRSDVIFFNYTYKKKVGTYRKSNHRQCVHYF